MEKYILSIDQGTSSTRVLLVNKLGKICFTSQKKIEQIYPKVGWVEHDALEIWNNTLVAIKDVLATNNILANQINSIGITNQRETVVAWNKESGKPIYNAIVWQSKQSQKQCDNLIENGHSKMVREKTGLPINTYFSGPKIMWLLKNVKEAKELLSKDKLLVGTIDTWLVWNLTGGKIHVTDTTNASRTMLFNIETLAWDEELLDIHGIPKSILPKVVDSNGVNSFTDKIILGEEIKITTMIGDQQASLFGHGCLEKGNIKCTYGTGGFVMANMGNSKPIVEDKLITTVAWTLNGITSYALEGSIFIAGAAVDWLKDGLKVIDVPESADRYSEEISDTNGVYVISTFAGLGAPYWDSKVKGSIMGLTRDTTKKHIVRATLESVSFRTQDILMCFEKLLFSRVESFRVDGGLANSNFMIQHIANLSQSSVMVSESKEISALGAAFISGFKTGFWENENEIIKIISTHNEYKPDTNGENENTNYAEWKKALELTRKFK